MLILEKHFHDISFPFVVTFTNLVDMEFRHSRQHSYKIHHKPFPKGSIYLSTDTETDDSDTFSHVLALCDNV